MNPEQLLVPPKIILFDWHATLVDTLDAMYHAVDDVIPKFGELGLLDRLAKPKENKTEEDRKLVEYVRNNQRLHPKIKIDKKISRTDIFEVLFCSDNDAKHIAHLEFNRCYRNHFGKIRPFEEGLDDMLADLKSFGLQLGVLTNRDREFLKHEINTIRIDGWAHFFDVTVCGDDVENRKPHPELILKALEWIDVEPDMSCWYVGDSTTDTIAANDAGVTNIFYNGANWDDNWLMKIFPGTTKHPHKPDYIVHNFSEFKSLVEATLPVRFSNKKTGVT